MMTTRKAVIKVMVMHKKSRYRIAKDLGISPIMITNYLKEEDNSVMGTKTADKFFAIYNIEISDIFNPTVIPSDDS